MEINLYKVLLGILIFFLGGTFSSFYNLFVYRRERNESFINGRSHCDFCNKKLYFYELIPVFSYIFLKGECSSCKNKIGKDKLITEFTVSILSLLIYLKYDLSVETFLVIGIITVVIFIGIIDYKSGYIYNIDLVILLILVIVLKIFQRASIFNSLKYFLGMGSIFYLLYFTTGMMGLGDVYYSFVMGFLAESLFDAFALFRNSFISAAVFSLVLIILNKKSLKDSIAFGPFISIAIVVFLLCRWIMFDKNIIKLKINDGYIEFKDKSNQKSKLIPIPYRIYRDGKILDYHHFYYKFDKILENIDFNKRDNIILIFDSTSTIHINYKIPKIKESEIKNFLKLELEDYGDFKLDDYEIFYRHKEEKDILDLSIDLVLKEIILKFKEILDKIGVENFEIIPEAQSIEKNGKYIEISVDYVKYIFVKDNLVNIYKKIYNENIRKLVEENNLEEKNASNIINLRYDPEELKIDEDFNFKFKNYFINDIYEMEKFAEGDRIYFLGNICDSDIIKEILKTYSSLKWNLLDEDIHIKFPERKEKKVKKVNYINLFLIVFSLGIVMANLIYFSNLKRMVENTKKNILTTKNTKLESEDNSSDKFQERNKVFLEKISKIQELENDKLIITAYSFQDGKIIVKGIVKDENYFNEIFKDFDIVNKGFYREDGFNKFEMQIK